MTAVTEETTTGSTEVRRSARSGAVGLLGAVVNGAFGFVLTAVIVRSYGPAGSGALYTVLGLVTIIGAMCCLGSDTGMLWALPRRRLGPAGDGSRLLVVALVPTLSLATLIAVAGYLAAGPISAALFDSAGGDGSAMLRLGFSCVPLVVAMLVLLGAVRAVRPVSSYVMIQNLLVPLARPALILASVAVGGGVLFGLGGWLLPVLFAAVLSIILIVRPLGVGSGAPLRPVAADWRSFWGFALPRAASATIDASSMWIGVLLTSALAGQEQAGIFAAVGRYVLAGLLIMHGLRVATAPQLSRLLGDQRRADAARVYRQTTVWIVLLSWPAYLVLAVFGPAFLRLFGPQFQTGADSMAILAGAMLVNVGVGLVQTVLLMSGNSRGHLMAALTGLVLNVATCFLLVPRYGAIGAAIAWSLGTVVENVIAAVLARRTLGEPMFTRPLVRAALGASGGTALACTIGVLVAGRDLVGLLVALAALALGCAALLTRRSVRHEIGEVRNMLRPKARAQEVQR